MVESKISKKTYVLPSIDISKPHLTRNKSMDYISTKDFLYNYYLHYKKTILDKAPNHITQNKTYALNNNINNNEYSSFYNCTTKYNESINNNINLNRFNFAINFTNDFVSDRKEIEAKKQQKSERIIKKSKKIIEQIEEKELFKYLQQHKKAYKKFRQDHSQDDISLDTCERNEIEVREEMKSQIIHKKLLELQKHKKFNLKHENQEIGKIFERYDDLRALELNFLKNKTNYILDSNFFNEYYFRLKKQMNDNRIKANLKAKFRNQNKKKFYNTIEQIKNKSKTIIISRNSINKNNENIFNRNSLANNTMRTINKSNSFLNKAISRNKNDVLHCESNYKSNTSRKIILLKINNKG